MWKKLDVEGIIPEGRSSSSMVCVGDKLYLFGGEKIPRVPVDDDLWQFDLKDLKWSILNTKGTPPQKRFAHTMCVSENTIYMYGGRLQNEEQDLADLFAYDIDKNEWKNITTSGDSPHSRSYHSMLIIEKHIYIFGGCQHDKDGTKRKNDLHVLNLDTLEWKLIKTKNDPPSIRGGTTMTCFGCNLFIHGGFSGKELDDFYSYNIEQGVWSKIDGKGSIPSARSVHTLLTLGSDLFVFGGEKEPSKLGHEGAGLYWDDSFLYDISKNEWKEIKETGPTPRGWITATTINKSTVALFGGFTGNDRTNDLWLFTV